MISLETVPGSFRDPSGKVYRKNNQIFRTITDFAAPDFAAVEATGLLGTLVDEALLIPWRDALSEVPDLYEIAGVARVLEHELLSFVSYPYEWSFGALKTAALTHLDIQLRALDHDVVLSDASAYNIQFRGPRPVFIDHLSFRPYREGQFWSGYRQFCEQFLNPLLLRARFGISHNARFRGNPEGIPTRELVALLPWREILKRGMLTNVFLPVWLESRKRSNLSVARTMSSREMPRAGYSGMIKSLRKLIAGLDFPDTESTWGDYAENTSYLENEEKRKQAFIAEFSTAVKPGVLWDLGCNTGEYSKIALENGAVLVIGFEFDSIALERAFERAVSENLNFLPLYMDAANPSPSQGWNQSEWDGLVERRNADGILALAVVHHLCIGRNVPLPDVLRWLVGHAPKGIIEFVPKLDPMVQELLGLRDDIFDDYTEENFDQLISGLGRVVCSKTITEHGRKLIWFERD